MGSNKEKNSMEKVKRKLEFSTILQISPSNLKRLEYWFNEIDSDKDGYITRAQGYKFLLDQGIT